MADDLDQKQPEDPTKINVGQQWEIDYWTEKLGVTEKQLKDAVAKVGVMVKDVKAELGI
ncbi:DUF3606 domain-containing protein [Parvicella tangerina]|uniref:DUF3606 domain-containing protein n=1 Tax=Parvicella tangerina TaxID=2829795 RepID=A0A916JQW2_9FLAO|nr:DUF3606 domain-containing protein [Parvicella tangerina]CAG5086811.1 hypothetical protein CRYO30217_03290 [Parvicella tangerina]